MTAERDLVDRILSEVCNCHDGTALWGHVRDDPDAFRRAVERALEWHAKLSLNTPQSAPTATDRTPAWELVLADMENNGLRDRYPQVYADMRARDAAGRAKYGVPLTSGNGREHLVDAYQEALDLVAYLRTELDEAEHRGDLDAPHTFGLNLRDIAVSARVAYGQALEGACLIRSLIDGKAAIVAGLQP